MDQAWALAHELLLAMREKFGMKAPIVENCPWQLGAAPELPGAGLFLFDHPYYGTLTFFYSAEEVTKWKKACTQAPPFAPGTNTKQ